MHSLKCFSFDCRDYHRKQNRLKLLKEKVSCYLFIYLFLFVCLYCWQLSAKPISTVTFEFCMSSKEKVIEFSHLQNHLPLIASFIDLVHEEQVSLGTHKLCDWIESNKGNPIKSSVLKYVHYREYETAALIGFPCQILSNQITCTQSLLFLVYQAQPAKTDRGL